jgi:hypothetical protein
MATTACTSYYTVNLVGYIPGSGSTVGVVTQFNTPKPVWTDTDYTNPTQVALQCSAVAIGGFNGLNS